MRSRLSRLLLVVVMTAGMLSLITGTAAAQSTAQPASCTPSPIVCVYQLNDYRDIGAVFSPATNGGQWISLTTYDLTLPWGSFADDSGSSVAFGDASTKQTKCYDAGSDVANPEVVHYRYIWIEYGDTDCNGTLGPLPSD